jgi:NDP-sugar pyrophosphorylase family protein
VPLRHPWPVVSRQPQGSYVAAMDAMIFAAGLGTRLRPLTDDRPKALVEVGGVPMLERVARRLIQAGADRIVVNVHHFPEKIEALVRERDGFGVDVRISREPDAPLDTGGGLQRAAHLFRGDRPILLHNCDVASTFDLRALHDAHAGNDAAASAGGAMATLAVLPPSPQRYLVFDDDGFCGYAPRNGGDDVLARPPRGATRHQDFAGIHVVSPRLLETLDGDGAYSIIFHYLRLAREGHRIADFRQPGVRWTDIGTHEQLALAQEL